MLAPTGTISFLMDCDTTGIEPDFSLVKFKELVGGGNMTIVNQTVPQALDTLGYTPEADRPDRGATSPRTARSSAPPALAEEHLPVFDVAVGERAISPHGPHQDDGRGAAVHLRRDLQDGEPAGRGHVEDVADTYMQGWKLGLKALAIYRDGSKTAQALRTEAQAEEPAAEDADRRAP